MGRLRYQSGIPNLKKAFLGIEMGSTRIKAVLIDDCYQVIAYGDYIWESKLIDKIWSYSLEEAEFGLRSSLYELISKLDEDIELQSVGLSGMMHGFLVFDENWNLLVPFRTWQNTMCCEASDILTERLNFNIPQRWSVAHLLQAVMNREEYVNRIVHMTSLAGYLHYRLTGKNTVCIDDASGMFPVDFDLLTYDRAMLAKAAQTLREYGFKGNLEEILPKITVAGNQAGTLTCEGLDFSNMLLPLNVPFAPPTGDGGTGMVATNTIAPRTGNVSAGTSIFMDVVLERPLHKVYPEIDILANPDGRPIAEIHGNNCTREMNLWMKMFQELLSLFGSEISNEDIYSGLFRHSLKGEKNCGEITVVNYLTGESITHLDEGRPMVIRSQNGNLSLSNFIRAHIFALFATLKKGLDILLKENVEIDLLLGHGGVFKTENVAQSYLAAICNTAVGCMKTAGEGGPYGMALLCAFMSQRQQDESLEEFLNHKVFKKTDMDICTPKEEDAKGFGAYMERFDSSLTLVQKAIEFGL